MLRCTVFTVVLLFFGNAIAQECSGPPVCSALFPDEGDGPTTNGVELVFEGGAGLVISSLRGTLAAGRQPDINRGGEVVYLHSDPGEPPQIFSTKRGQLTFIAGDVGANSPAINSLGEVVYAAPGPGGIGQVFSTTRGQLTSLDNVTASSPDQLSIDDSGRVVFEANDPEGTNIWELTPEGQVNKLTFFHQPKQGRQPTLAAVSGELVYLVIESCNVNLISDRDGILFTGGNTCGADRFTEPDLGAHGELVMLDHEANLVVRPTIVWRGDAGNRCGVPGYACGLGECDLNDNGQTDLADSTILRRWLAGAPIP